ncbi:MAG: cupredoxin family copper-binding protein [Sphingomonas sp.]|jgi:amicyanin|uniref:cupredoxin domain-containing protein n=1 Tax=Sphingomonas sp. TaxID=28214 RepID=UPI00356284FC
MFRYSIVLLAALAGVVAAPVASRPVAAQAATAAPMVHISNFTFGPQALKVKVGQTVTWVNDDDIPHTVASGTKVFKSKVLDTGDTFSFTFTKAGAYAYFCSLHPHMTGKVLVSA